jgi:hypothetical protein
MVDKKISVTVCYPDRAAVPTTMSVSELCAFLHGLTTAHLYGCALMPERIETRPVDEVLPCP